MSDQTLRMWAVYDHPKDFPDSFVARLWTITAEGVEPTGSFVQSPNLEVVRHHMLEMGLCCLSRHPTDDPVIVEAWL